MTAAAPFVATSSAIFAGGYDFTSDTVEASCKGKYDEVDNTTFASGGAQNLLAGLVKGAADIKGFYDPAINGVAVPGQLAGATNLLTVAPSGIANDRAFMLRGLASGMEGPQMPIGAMAKFDVHYASANNEGPLYGFLLLPKTTAAANSTGAVQNDGAVLSTQSIYGFLHVTAASGTTPSLAVTIKSAALVGFGSPTTRLTFGAQAAIGSNYQTATGPITDAFWRVDYTITGTAPSFTFAVGFAIQ